MTTTVTVHACCRDDTEVEIRKYNSDTEIDVRVIQDGETVSESVSHDRTIRVAERKKVDPEPVKSDSTEKAMDEAFHNEMKKG